MKTESMCRSNVERVDGRAKVTGKAQFTGDLTVPGMTYGKVLRSDLAHARIVRVDASAAEQLPGVVAVLTGADLADIDPYYGHAIKDRTVIAIDRVRFAGEPVAAVAAVDEATASEALSLIQVDYEELPVVATLEQAMAENAPRLHDTSTLRAGLFHGLGELKAEPGNICYHHTIEKGDVNAAFAKADVIVEGEYLFPAVYQYSMEPHTAIAQWGEDGLTVWACCQHPHLVRAELASLFGLAFSRTRVIVPFIGGGFGSKSYTKIEPLTAALARKARRPVRIVNTIEEAMMTTRRHNMKCWMRTAATREGRLIAREVRAWLDTGAYADNGPRVVATAADAAPGPYRWESMKVDAWGIYTNTPPSGSYRAFGSTHMQWIAESQVDEIARKVSLDTLEIRVRNLLHPGEQVRPGGKALDADLVGDIRRIANMLNWDSPKPLDVGRGLSVGLLAAGAQPVSTAIVRLEVDGTATIFVSTTELGQGAQTVFSQLVAEQLALPIELVRVLRADTAVTPYDRSTGASRSTSLAGMAVQRAAIDVREQLVKIAAEVWQVTPGSLELRDGAVWDGTRPLSYGALFKHHFGMSGGELIGHGEVRPDKGKANYREGPVFWEVCISGAEARVDRDTGRVHINKLVSVADAGTAINPHLVEAQEMGAALQGVGNGLFEEMVFDNGQLLNGNMVDYHVPTVDDLPDEFASELVENEDGPGPYGAKGIAEGGVAAVPSALANALGDIGISMHELPMTPERVWREISRKRERGEG